MKKFYKIEIKMENNYDMPPDFNKKRGAYCLQIFKKQLACELFFIIYSYFLNGNQKQLLIAQIKHNYNPYIFDYVLKEILKFKYNEEYIINKINENPILEEMRNFDVKSKWLEECFEEFSEGNNEEGVRIVDTKLNLFQEKYFIKVVLGINNEELKRRIINEIITNVVQF